MKKVLTDSQTRIKGYYLQEFIDGFFGSKDEGRIALKQMGLSPVQLPFSAAKFLQARNIRWKDKEGNIVRISFQLKPNQLECFGFYLGKKKSYRLFTEWGDREDIDMIARMESGAIGDLCMKCICDIME